MTLPRNVEDFQCLGRVVYMVRSVLSGMGGGGGVTVPCTEGEVPVW